jgi:hypothetical protein
MKAAPREESRFFDFRFFVVPRFARSPYLLGSGVMRRYGFTTL